jgi:3-phosphoshikimate 1-carboxyvinyltransferase
MGRPLRTDDAGWLEVVPGPLDPIDVEVPADVSSAAFLLVAASLVPGSEVELPAVGLNPTRTGVIDALRAMGADIEVVDEDRSGVEPMATLVVRHAPLRGHRIDGDLALRSLDELPVLAVAAAFAEGETVIADAAELRVKESDRIARVAEGLRRLGVQVEERPDGMVIQGGVRSTVPAEVDASGDHRIAMAFTVAGLVAPAGVRVRSASAVHSSWPSFYDDLTTLLPRRAP